MPLKQWSRPGNEGVFTVVAAEVRIHLTFGLYYVVTRGPDNIEPGFWRTELSKFGPPHSCRARIIEHLFGETDNDEELFLLVSFVCSNHDRGLRGRQGRREFCR